MRLAIRESAFRFWGSAFLVFEIILALAGLLSTFATFLFLVIAFVLADLASGFTGLFLTRDFATVLARVLVSSLETLATFCLLPSTFCLFCARGVVLAFVLTRLRLSPLSSFPFFFTALTSLCGLVTAWCRCVLRATTHSTSLREGRPYCTCMGSHTGLPLPCLPRVATPSLFVLLGGAVDALGVAPDLEGFCFT
jgi:hypothetical protein